MNPAPRRGRAPLRLVLDTNVVLSALVFGGGNPGRLRAAWIAGSVIPLASADTARELIRVLAYPKFRLDAESREHLLADYLPYTQAVRIPSPPPAVSACRDPHDVPFLHLTVSGRAQALVTGDADLLALAGVAAFPIVTVEQLLRDRLP